MAPEIQNSRGLNVCVFSQVNDCDFMTANDTDLLSRNPVL